jgi:cAMP-dependent protein kinase regulator
MRKNDENQDLQHVQLFEGLDRHTLELVRRLTTEVRRPAGAVWMQEGDIGFEAIVVLEGEAVVTVDGVEVGRVLPGDVVGERALLTHEPRTATVTALTPMRVLVLDRREFASLLADAPEVAHRVTRTMAIREAS